MRILCGAFTKDGELIRGVLGEDKGLDIPFTLFDLESRQVVPFDDVDHIRLIGDMDKDPPDEVSVADFDASTRRMQATISQKVWAKIERELKQRGVFLHDRH